MERHHAHPNSIEANILRSNFQENVTNKDEAKQVQKVAERIKKTYNIMVMNFDEDFQD